MGLLAAVLLVAQSGFCADKGIPKMNALVRSVHQQFLKLKGSNAFFQQYSDACLLQQDGRAVIRYTPPEKEEAGPQPQQSSHISIGYVDLNQPHQAKYWNVFEDNKECQFPSLQSRVYGEVLIWEDRKLEERVKRIVIEECKRRSSGK